MKLLSLFRGDRKRSQAAESEEPKACEHPVVKVAYGDPADPKKVTGLTCDRCGAALPLPEEKAKAA